MTDRHKSPTRMQPVDFSEVWLHSLPFCKGSAIQRQTALPLSLRHRGGRRPSRGSLLSPSDGRRNAGIRRMSTMQVNCAISIIFQPWPNGCNMLVQHRAILLHATCCVRLATPAQHVTWSNNVACNMLHRLAWALRPVFTHAIFDAISRTKRALPYPTRMFIFREASRGLERKLSHIIWRHPFQFLLTKARGRLGQVIYAKSQENRIEIAPKTAWVIQHCKKNPILESLTLSLPNVTCSLIRNITSHSMKILAFHPFRW